MTNPKYILENPWKFQISQVSKFVCFFFSENHWDKSQISKRFLADFLLFKLTHFKFKFLNLKNQKSARNNLEIWG